MTTNTESPELDLALTTEASAVQRSNNERGYRIAAQTLSSKLHVVVVGMLVYLLALGNSVQNNLN